MFMKSGPYVHSIKNGFKMLRTCSLYEYELGWDSLRFINIKAVYKRSDNFIPYLYILVCIG